MSNTYFGTPAEIEAARAFRREQIQEHSRELLEEAHRLKMSGGHMIIGPDPVSEAPATPPPSRPAPPVERPVSKKLEPHEESLLEARPDIVAQMKEAAETGELPDGANTRDELETLEPVETPAEAEKPAPKATKSTSKGSTASK